MIQLRTFLGNGRVVIRLTIAFLIGLLLGLLAGKVGAGMQNLVPFLLFPLLIGVASAFTVSTRKPHPYLIALCTGLMAWGGAGVYLLIMAAQTSLAPCTTRSCGSTT